MEKLLQGKTALITGAGQNIGKSIAIEMAQQGCNIIFTDIDQNKCQQLEDELRTKYSGIYHGNVSDISKEQDIENLLKYLDEKDINSTMLNYPK